MKKHLLFILFFFAIIFSAFAQNVHWARHVNTELAGKMACINSKCYYIERVNGYGCCIYTPFLNCISSNGLLINTTNIGFAQQTYISDLYVTTEKEFIVFGSPFSGCDSPKKHFLAKIDTTGNVLFKIELNVPGFNAVTDFAAYPDSTFYVVVYGSALWHYSKTGVLLSQKNLGITGITTLDPWNNGNFIISHGINNTFWIWEMDTSGIWVNQFFAPNTIKKAMRLSSGNFVALGANALQKYSMSSGFLGSSTLTIPSSYTVTDYDMRNDTLYVTGFTPLKKPFYYMLDQNFNILHQTVSTCPSATPTGICLNNKSKINIISNGSNGSDCNYTGFFQTSFTGSINSDSDVGVKNFSVISAFWKDYGNNYRVGSADVNAVIQNYGTDTVKNFHLVHYSSPYSSCYAILNKAFSITIAPGGTVEVNSGIFDVRVIPPDLKPDGSAWVKLCLYTTVPNGRYDVNIDNDSACDSVSLIYTGLEENSTTAQKISVFPNPFSKRISISSESIIKYIEITDLLGRCLRSYPVNDKNIELEEDFPGKGLLFFRIVTERGAMVIKVIRE